MRQKLIALLVGFCVLLTPMLSNAGMPVPVAAAESQSLPPSCHTAQAEAALVSQDDSPMANGQAAHACCFNAVGILPAMMQSLPRQGSVELTPFNPSLSLISRVEGLYRPPRQIS